MKQNSAHLNFPALPDLILKSQEVKMGKTEVLFENGERALLDLTKCEKIKFDRFVRINDSIVVGLIVDSPIIFPVMAIWADGVYIGSAVVKKPDVDGGCGGGGGCSGGNCHGKGDGGGFQPGGAGHC